MAGGRKRGWFSKILGRSSRDDADVDYELVVIDGADEGACFSIDRDQIQIGRAAPGSRPDSGILLSDRSVSAKQALLSRERGKLILEHLPSATNPTLVNGRRIKQRRIRDGDRVALGFVVLELRAVRPAPPQQPPPMTRQRGRPATGREATDPVNFVAQLVVTDGPEDLVGRSFPVDRARTRIGREETCEVVVDVGAVSRKHASLVWDGDQLVIVHESSVNPTEVNGRRIHDRRRVFHGDEIRISDRVAFEVLLEMRAVPAGASPGAGARPASDARADSEADTRLTTPPRESEAATLLESAENLEEAPTRVTTTDPPMAYEKVPQPEPRPEAATVLDEPEDPEATSLDLPARDFSDGEATRISDAPAPPDYTEGDRTRLAEPPAAPDYAEGDRTRLADPPGAAVPPEEQATRVMPAMDLPDGADDATREAVSPEEQATRVMPALDLPDRADDSPGQAVPPEEQATRVMPAMDLPDGADDSTRQAVPPEEQATRVMPALDLPDVADETTRQAVPTGEQATRVMPALDLPDDGADDPERTMLRPSPHARPAREEGPAPPGDDVVDLDASLAEETAAAPAPAEPDDAEQTLIRPAPQSHDAPTLIRPAPRLQSADDDDPEKTVMHRVPDVDEPPATRFPPTQKDDDDPERTVMHRVPDIGEPAATRILAPQDDDDDDPERTVMHRVPDADEPAATRIISPQDDDDTEA